MKINEILNEETSRVSEKWSKKYKRSIDCSHPKGFSQKAHCAGRKKHKESREIYPESLYEFAVDGDGNNDKNGRWYTDVQLAGIIGEDWNDFDVGQVMNWNQQSKEWLIREVQLFLDDLGYNVIVSDVRDNYEQGYQYLDWYIEGNFYNPRFSNKDISEGFNSKQEVIAHFIKQGKSAAAGAAAWERGWRGATKKKEVKPFDPEKNKNVRLPYIDEAASNLTKEDDLSIFIRELFKNCSDMMSIFKKDTRLNLYRGSKRSTPNFSLTRYDIGNRQKKIEQGSTDTPELLNQRMNLNHSADSGLPFRYGMFCTGDALDATEYGKLSVIFPMNGFKFCYSPKIRDLYGKIPAYIETMARNNNDLDTAFEFIDDLYNKADYEYGSSKNSGLLSEAILSHNEIMIYPPNNESSLYYYRVDYTFYRDKVLPLIFEKLNLVY